MAPHHLEYREPRQIARFAGLEMVRAREVARSDVDGARTSPRSARLGRAREPQQDLAFEKFRTGEIGVGYVHDPVSAGGEALVPGALVIELAP